MHRFNGFATLGAAANVGLVGDDNQKEVRGLESRAPVCDIIVEFEILNAGWRIRPSIPNHSPIEDSVTIQKNPALRYFMLSHFVSANFRAG